MIEIKDDGTEETENIKIAPDPGQPTGRQVEEHRQRCHLPYRLWCKWCLMGRGRGAPHSKRGSSAIPIVGLDYFYITRGGVKFRKELELPEDEAGNRTLESKRLAGEIVKCLVIRCSSTKAVFGHVVPCKGPDEDNFVANLVADAVAWLGHTKLILKADNEASLQALVVRALEVIRVKCEKVESASKEQPPEYDSQSNGATEVGVRLIRGLFRTLKLCLEARIGKFVPINHALIPWLLEHTCLSLNAIVVGEDGMTAWARARGRPFGQALFGFAEVVLYKLPQKGPKANPDGNMGTQWREAIFLGHNRNANTFILGTKEGIVYSRSATRRPLSDRWNADRLGELQATPWSIREKPEVETHFQEAAAHGGDTADTAAPAAPRRFRINQSDLEAHEYTVGCPQCDHIRRYGKAKPGGSHNNVCRERLLRAIGASDVGKTRLEQHDERTNRAIAERIEHEDKKRSANAPAAAAGQARGASVGQPTDVLPGASAAAGGEGPAAAPRPASRSMRIEVEPPDEQTWTNVPGGDQAPQSPKPAASSDRLQDAIGEQHKSRPPAFNAGDEADGDATMEAEGSEDTNMDFIGALGSLEPSFDDEISELMLNQMGSTRSYHREGRKAMRRVVSEVYSPPRVTAALRKMKSKFLAPGFALDLTVMDPEDGLPWDFTKAKKREKARDMVRKYKPYMLIGSPVCTQFSTWQYLNRFKHGDNESKERARVEAVMHMDFVISLYYEQIEGGRYFLHEHPNWATSWSLDKIETMLRVPGVRRVRGDQCQFGAEIQRGRHRGDPIMKPTGFMTNSPCVAETLERLCEGKGGLCSRSKGGRHRPCSGIHAKEAQKYPKELCRAVLKGVTKQLKDDNLLKNGCFGVQVPDDDAEVLKNTFSPEQGYSGRYRDDLTGQVLRDDLVQQARAKELAYFAAKGVWQKVSRAKARLQSGRSPISVRWVDVNKGDEINTNYRSRLVARQIRALDRSGQTYFAPAPPLEALRTVLSMAMTKIGSHQPDWNPHSPTRTQISFVDVSRAYFNAQIDENEPPTFVSLPEEDPDHGDMCARLLRHMYGTRMAADGWQEEYSTMLIKLGFRQGEACPNVFRHPDRKIVCSVHGDDFTSSGPADALDWLETSIGKEYEITIGPRLGPGPQDAKEGRALNRIIRWCDGYIAYEADPRQIERLVDECGLEGSKAVTTPGVKANKQELADDADLPQHLHTAFRGAAARSNYIAADRIDAQYACKEVCRWMAKPSVQAWKALKRICRYLNGLPRLTYTYRQQVVSCIDVYTDTDWAGCPRTRKSTSGGCVVLGRHTVKHWSSTQTSVALSSGEAEFAGVIRGSGQGLGYQALLKDLGVEVPVRVWTDSSAALGICSRQGLGGIRHLDTHMLWIQQAVRGRRIDLRKIDGEKNPADLLTKHSLSRSRLEALVELYDCKFLTGRAESAPRLRRGESSKVTMAQAGDGVDLDAVTGDDPSVVLQGTLGNDDGEPAPIMPHVTLSESQLNRLYPRIEAPVEDQLEDLKDDQEDRLLHKGLQVAQEISERARSEGRRRHEKDAKDAIDKHARASGSHGRQQGQRDPAGGVHRLSAGGREGCQ